MSFGQQSGPPASDKQVQYLLALVQKAGYTDFREARHPLSLNQRQAKGRFTRGEASELIDRLLGGEPAGSAGVEAAPAPAATAATTEAADRPDAHRSTAARGRTLRELPLERLIAELERRGFTVVAAPAAAAAKRTERPASSDQDGSMP